MNLIILFISVIGIICICYTVNNYSCINNCSSKKVEIHIIKLYDGDDERKELVDKILYGKYENLLDIVDNVRIN